MNRIFNFFMPKMTEFHASKYIMNILMLSVSLSSIYTTFVKDELIEKQIANQTALISEQFKVIQENEKKSEIAKERFSIVLIEYSNQFRNLIVYFEDIKGRVGRERENYNVLVGILIAENQKYLALLMEILEISEKDFSEIQKKHKISIDSSYMKNERAYNSFIKAQKLNKKP